MTESILIIVFGLICFLYLFRHFPFAPMDVQVQKTEKISVIIPARNEENNLSLLLSDLHAQSLSPFEIICVDDCSTDNTRKIALSYNAQVISVQEKPDNWVGKSYACFMGAQKAKGDLFLFLDADVRLGKNGILKIINAYKKDNCTVSFQPRHSMKKLYESFSLFFNLVMFAANGLGIKNGKNIGLIGPVILISREDYDAIGGHFSIRDSVIDDISLGLELKKHNISFKLYLGDNDIFFRMYNNGFENLFRGWMKNIASGAMKTPLIRFLFIFFFITSCISVSLNLVLQFINFNLISLFINIIFYFIWVILLARVANKIGDFKLISLVFYPVTLGMFLLICILSSFKKLFHIKTDWKGRKV